MSQGRRIKFGHGIFSPDEAPTPVDHGNRWQVEQTTGPLRLVVGPANDHIETLIALARELPEPFFVLYVLLVSRRDEHATGRYQSPEPLSRSELEQFLAGFRDFLEGDGRHHIWVASPDAGATLVYDNHNVIYAYGPVERFEDVLAGRGFAEGPVGFPVPHSHHYNAEFDDDETRLLRYCEWVHSPLQPHDNP